jgi:hypothetical protein
MLPWSLPTSNLSLTLLGQGKTASTLPAAFVGPPMKPATEDRCPAISEGQNSVGDPAFSGSLVGFGCGNDHFGSAHDGCRHGYNGGGGMAGGALGGGIWPAGGGGVY